MNHYDQGRHISLLVPFRDDHAQGRGPNWAWLKRHWEIKLPCAEIVIGEDHGNPFSKTCAVNHAFQRASLDNDVIVILDADCYIAADVILECAAAIRESRRWGERLWFVPYRFLYRLTETATCKLVASDPAWPIRFSPPHQPEDVGNSAQAAAIGHHFGALIQIMPREAFLVAGGMDPRFRGWGGEDVTLVRVLDTLFGIHHTTQNEVMTLWHTAFGDVFLRKWEGQDRTGINNDLSLRYRKTRRDPLRMQAIVREWLDDPLHQEHRIHPAPPWYPGDPQPD